MDIKIISSCHQLHHHSASSCFQEFSGKIINILSLQLCWCTIWPLLIKKVVLCSFQSRWKHISQDDTISLTHLDPHMMHKVFDTDWISGSFQISGNGLKMPPAGTLKGKCSVLIYMLSFEGKFEHWFIIVHIVDKQKSLMSCKKGWEREVEETRCFVKPGIFSAFVPWKYLGHPSLQSWPKLGQYILPQLFSPVLASLKFGVGDRDSSEADLCQNRMGKIVMSARLSDQCDKLFLTRNRFRV